MAFFLRGFSSLTLVSEFLVVMSTGAVNMAVLKLFGCGFANIGNSHIKVEVFARERVIAVDSNSLVSNQSNGYWNSSTLTGLSFKLHTPLQCSLRLEKSCVELLE